MKFVIEIPADALPPNVETITMRVPQGGISSTYPPVYEFLPDLTFLEGMQANLTLYYPPWLDADPNGIYVKYSFRQDPPGSNNYAYDDLGLTGPDGGPGGRRFVFTTTHFSRWTAEPSDPF